VQFLNTRSLMSSPKTEYSVSEKAVYYLRGVQAISSSSLRSGRGCDLARLAGPMRSLGSKMTP
jgi:hypothetical protein